MASLEWGDKQTLKKLASEHKPPQMVLLDSDSPSPVEWGPLVDMKRPFLLYSARRRTKIIAEYMELNSKKNEYIGTGDYVEIPKDYKGWFEVVPKNNKKVGHYATIQTIATSGCNYFLVRTLTAGFLSKEENGELEILQEEKIYPGEILKVVENCEKVWKTKELEDMENEVVKKDSKKEAKTRFLKCTDHKDREICIPLAHPGIYNTLGSKKTKEQGSVYQMEGIMNICKISSTCIKLVFGWPPPFKKEISGVFRIVKSYRPDTIMAYHYGGDTRNVICEIPTLDEIVLRRAENLTDFKENEEYQRVQTICSSLVFRYAITMKPLNIKTADLENEETFKLENIMAEPRNMDEFNPLDIFPSIEDKNVSDGWTISFKDPDFLYQDDSNNIAEEDAWTETSSTESGTSLIRKKKIASKGANNRQSMAGYDQDADGMREDLRETRMKQSIKREANC